VLPVVLNRRVVGLLYADRQNDGEAFSDEDVGDLQTLADIFALAIKG
jgi:GAF domain-containing protein